jgi:hypothetical protein
VIHDFHVIGIVEMEFEEILGPQFSVHWSTCSPIPGKRFPITESKSPQQKDLILKDIQVEEEGGNLKMFSGR